MELSLEQFLNTPGTIFDVRSPGEFLQGRIPHSVNLPIFSNDERAIVGTAYKQVGKERAIELGLQIVGPKLADFVAQAKQVLAQSPHSVAKVHCWRGGMRSSSMAWLLQTAGIKTVILKGGYKTFRRHVLNTLELTLENSDPHFFVIGGLTGSGKTSILNALSSNGEQVLDLEGLAGHRGSSFGMLGLPSQKSVEQFENEIALKLLDFDYTSPIWVEDESRMIGTCKIPASLYQKIHSSPLLIVERPLSERIEKLCQDYSFVTKEELIEATKRLSRKLGGLKTSEIVQLIENQHVPEAVESLLSYYDSTYCHSLSKRQKPLRIVYKEGLSSQQWAALLQEETKGT